MNPRHFFSTLIVGTALALLSSLPAQAQGWQVHTGIMASDPNCARQGASVVCAAIGENGTLIVNRFDGTAWTGFQDLGGNPTRKPSCTRHGILPLLCASIDTASRLFVKVHNGSTWSAFQILGGQSVSDPSCAGVAFLGTMSTICAFIGVDGAMHVARHNGSHWQFEKLGGNYIYNPTCTEDWTFNDMFCAVVNIAGQLEGWKFTSNGGGIWTRLPPVGFGITADPHCTGIGTHAPPVPSKILCAVRSGVRLKVNRADSAATWPQFTDLGGILTAAPSCMPTINPFAGTPAATCAVRNTNSGIHMISFNGATNTWGSYQLAPAVFMVGAPNCTFFGSQTLCAVRGTNNRLHTLLGP